MLINNLLSQCKRSSAETVGEEQANATSDNTTSTPTTKFYKIEMKSSFVFLSLETGSLIIGWLQLVWLTLTPFVTSESLEDDKDNIEGRFLGPYLNSQNAVAFVYVIILILGIIAYISLIHGVYKESPRFLIPYLVVSVIKLILHSVGFLCSIVIVAMSGYNALTHPIAIMITFIVSIVIGIYFYCVVLSYYKELRSIPKTTNPA